MRPPTNFESVEDFEGGLLLLRHRLRSDYDCGRGNARASANGRGHCSMGRRVRDHARETALVRPFRRGGGRAHGNVHENACVRAHVQVTRWPLSLCCCAHANASGYAHVGAHANDRVTKTDDGCARGRDCVHDLPH